MDPKISNLTEEDGILSFRLSGVNVSLANGLRRIILSEIPTIVFRTAPHDKNRVDIEINTTRMNNELIKQRISCVPIHITDTEFPLEDYVVEVDKQNDGDAIDYVTTGEFRVRNVKTDSYLTEAATRKMFPADPITGDFIELVRLRPRLSESIGGEHFKMTARFDIGMAKQDAAFNVVSTCSYAASPDPIKINEVWTEKEKVLKASGESVEDIAIIRADWLLLEAKRYTIPETFDFVVESVGPFDNNSIVWKAANVMIDKLQKLATDISAEDLMVAVSDSTIENSYDITLENEDYTLGKVVEYVLYSSHYAGLQGTDKALSYCGFRKPHPHIPKSVIRLGFTMPKEKSEVAAVVARAAEAATVAFQKLASEFSTD